MSGKFKINQSNDRQFYFVLHAANGEPILVSETYVTKDGARRGIESVRNNASMDRRYQRKVSISNEHYFTLHAANGEPIGTSEMYSSPASRNVGIESVKINAVNAVIEVLV